MVQEKQNWTTTINIIINCNAWKELNWSLNSNVTRNIFSLILGKGKKKKDFKKSQA